MSDNDARSPGEAVPFDDQWGGMETGSDAGAPGDHLPDPPLTDDEQALLDELKRPVEGEPIVAVEDSAQAVEAAEDDGPLPPSPA